MKRDLGADMDTRSPSLKVLAAAVILAALISLICPSAITIKPIFLLAAVGLALVRPSRPPAKGFCWHDMYVLKSGRLRKGDNIDGIHDAGILVPDLEHGQFHA